MLQSCRNIPTNVPNSPQASFLISDKIMKHVYITIWFNTSENVTHTVQDQNSMKSPRCVGVHVLVREVMRSWDTGRVDRKKSTLWLTWFKNMWGSQVTGYSYSWYRIFFGIEPLRANFTISVVFLKFYSVSDLQCSNWCVWLHQSDKPIPWFAF